MSDQEDRLKKIMAYEDQELSAEEKMAFEKALTTDKALADTWQLSQEVDKAIRNPKALGMEALLQDMGNEFAAKHTPAEKKIIRPTKVRSLYPFAIAASFALLIAVGWWQWNQVNPLDAQTLYANVYEPYFVSSTIRSTNTDLVNTLVEGQQKYIAGDYEATIRLLTPLLVNQDLSKEDLMATQFYIGLSQLATNQLNLAQTSLTAVVGETQHLYTQQAQWYLALIALKKEDIVQTKNWLNQVLATASTGKYARKAEALLAQLK